MAGLTEALEILYSMPRVIIVLVSVPGYFIIITYLRKAAKNKVIFSLVDGPLPLSLKVDFFWASLKRKKSLASISNMIL